jgi:hypothetical protein
MKFQGKIDKDGVLRIVNRAYFDKFLKDELAEKEVTIEVKKKTRQRSNNQNRYLHSCVIPILRNAFKDIGHNLSNEEVHLFLKTKFLKISMANENGEFTVADSVNSALTGIINVESLRISFLLNSKKIEETY